MSDKNFPNEEIINDYRPEGPGYMNPNVGYQQNHPPVNMQYSAPQSLVPNYNNNYVNNNYTAKNIGYKPANNQFNPNNAAYGYGANGNIYGANQMNYAHDHFTHHHGYGYGPNHPYGYGPNHPYGYGNANGYGNGPYHYHHHHDAHMYAPYAYNQAYGNGYGPYNSWYGSNVHMDDDYMKHHWFNWLHPGYFKSFLRRPRVNNFFRGVGIATVGLLAAPSIARVLRPIAVQVMHGVKDIADELKGVVDDAREEMDDIFADANWEGLKFDDERKNSQEEVKS